MDNNINNNKQPQPSSSTNNGWGITSSLWSVAASGANLASSALSGAGSLLGLSSKKRDVLHPLTDGFELNGVHVEDQQAMRVLWMEQSQQAFDQLSSMIQGNPKSYDFSQLLVIRMGQHNYDKNFKNNEALFNALFDTNFSDHCMIVVGKADAVTTTIGEILTPTFKQKIKESCKKILDEVGKSMVHMNKEDHFAQLLNSIMPHYKNLVKAVMHNSIAKNVDQNLIDYMKNGELAQMISSLKADPNNADNYLVDNEKTANKIFTGIKACVDYLKDIQ